MRIFKYQLTFPNGSVELPTNTKIIDFQFQQKEPTIWALVDEEATKKKAVKFVILPTGAKVPPAAEYIKTAFFTDGTVWHLFRLYASGVEL